jgi:hypothetical protein
MWLSFDKETVDALKQLLARKDLVCELPVEVSGQLTDALETIEKAEAAHNSVSRAAFREAAEELVSNSADVKIDADAVVEVDNDDTAEAFVMAWVRVGREDDDEEAIDEEEEEDEEVVDDDEGSPLLDEEE